LVSGFIDKSKIKFHTAVGKIGHMCSISPQS
jgi:hypothetical protein